MDIMALLLRFAGKNGLKIDQRIRKQYIVRQCWKYGWMMIRGTWYSFGKKNIDKSLFKGTKVRILECNNLYTGKKVKLQDGVYIDALSEGGVRLSDGVVLGRNTRIECTGGLNYLGKGCIIGARTTFGNDCFFGAAGGIKIGEDVVAGQYIRFHSENHNYDRVDILIKEQGVSHKGITIGNNCWIGSGAVFLDGAELGDGCVVAANAVVTKKFPNNSVVAGIPAKTIKNRGGKI